MTFVNTIPNEPLEPQILSSDHGLIEDQVIISGKFLKMITEQKLSEVTYLNSVGEIKPVLSAVFTKPNPEPEAFFTMPELVEWLNVSYDYNYQLNFAGRADRRLCLRRSKYRDISQMVAIAEVLDNLHDVSVMSSEGKDDSRRLIGTPGLLVDLEALTVDFTTLLPKCAVGKLTFRDIRYITILQLNTSGAITEAWIYHPSGKAMVRISVSMTNVIEVTATSELDIRMMMESLSFGIDCKWNRGDRR